jgi:uncharacterized membrane protein (UPF0127 family)
MIFRRQRTSGNLSVTLIVSGAILVIGSTFLLFVLPNLTKPATNLWLGDGIFNTDIALTPAAREQGLSGKPELQADHALLMAFPSEGEWGIWMKDMNFPIDIVWLSKDKKVIYVVKDAPPEDQTTVYKPEKPAMYVVELPSGTTSSKAINLNDIASFQTDGKAQ